MRYIITIVLFCLSCFASAQNNNIESEVSLVRDELNKASNFYLAALASFGAATFFHYYDQNNDNINARMARNGLYAFSGTMAISGTIHLKFAGKKGPKKSNPRIKRGYKE